MKYKLKDEKLAEHFRAIYPTFDEELNIACKRQMEDKSDYIHLTIYGINRVDHEDELFFKKSAIKEILKYNRKDWNSYPEVMPPHNIALRVEYQDTLGAFRKTCGVFFKPASDDPAFWIDFNSKKLEFQSLRFRPWED